MRKDIHAILNKNTVHIPKNLDVFQGHFENYPIVPGIYSIEIALLYLKRLWQKDVRLQKIEKCKFNRPILPNSELEVCVVSITSEDRTHKIKLRLVDQEDKKNTIVEMNIVVTT